MGKIFQTSFVDIVIGTGIYISGDALGAKQSFPNVGGRGEIVGVTVIDRDSEEANLDVVFFNEDITGSADHDPFAPTDAELSTMVGAVLVNTWKTFSTNSIGVESNVRMPYWAKSGTLFFQCVTRAIPTYAAVTDVLVSITVEN